MNSIDVNLGVFRHNKEADIFVKRGDDFHASWLIGDVLVSVEYIPENSPSLTLDIKDVKGDIGEIEKELEELGFKG